MESAALNVKLKLFSEIPNSFQKKIKLRSLWQYSHQVYRPRR